MTDITEKIAAKFRSGNSVPVERAVVLGKEWEELIVHIRALEAEAYKDACVREALEWQPIETAPRVAGRRVMILKDCGRDTLRSISIAYWLSDRKWHLDNGFETAEEYGYRVTHWMPLPEAPTDEENPHD